MVLRAYGKSQERSHQGAIAVAWTGAALARAKRMPSLKKLLGIKEPPPSQEELDLVRRMMEEVE